MQSREECARRCAACLRCSCPARTRCCSGASCATRARAPPLSARTTSRPPRAWPPACADALLCRRAPADPRGMLWDGASLCHEAAAHQRMVLPHCQVVRLLHSTKARCADRVDVALTCAGLRHASARGRGRVVFAAAQCRAEARAGWEYRRAGRAMRRHGRNADARAAAARGAHGGAAGRAAGGAGRARRAAQRLAGRAAALRRHGGARCLGADMCQLASCADAVHCMVESHRLCLMNSGALAAWRAPQAVERAPVLAACPS